MWNNPKPTFNYEILMPFLLNQRLIDYIETGFFILELWNRNRNDDDDLLGTIKLELFPIIDSLRVGDNLISLAQHVNNLLPMIIYDGCYPITSFNSRVRDLHLNLVLGFGSSAQVNYLYHFKR